MNGTTRAGLLRLLARGGSVVSLVFFGLVLTSGGPSPSGSEWVGLVFYPGTVALGLILAWRRELAGGALALAGLGGFYVWHLLDAGRFPGGPYFALLASPAVLFLASALLRERGQG